MAATPPRRYACSRWRSPVWPHSSGPSWKTTTACIPRTPDSTAVPTWCCLGQNEAAASRRSRLPLRRMSSSRSDAHFARTATSRDGLLEACGGPSVCSGRFRAGPLRARMTFRVIVRTLSERSFRRTELRRALTDEVGRRQPKWRIDDPAALELWAIEYQPGRFVAGLRASDVRMRQHQGRAAERTGALRPTVAAAMVRLAGEPRGRLLDPCCGSGTLLAEAQHRGWQGSGGD